jgi:hypothetical protein
MRPSHGPISRTSRVPRPHPAHPSTVPRQAGCGRDAPTIPRCKRHAGGPGIRLTGCLYPDEFKAEQRNMSATWKKEIAAARENSRDFSGRPGN